MHLRFLLPLAAALAVSCTTAAPAPQEPAPQEAAPAAAEPAPAEPTAARRSADAVEEEPAATQAETAPTPPSAPSAKRPPANGHLDPQSAMQVFNGHEHQIRECYEQALKEDGKLGGLFKVRVRIEPDGSVSRVETVDDQIDHEPMVLCVRAKMKTWSFSSVEGGAVEVVKSYIFDPGSKAPSP